MSPHLNAEIAAEHRRELLATAAAYRRTRTVRQPEAHKGQRRYGRTHRVSAFMEHRAAAQL